MNALIKDVLAFRDERNWKQYHDEKDLAISIVLEASELLENFQWKTSKEAKENDFQNIKEEMADVLIYLIQLADKLDIDLEKEGLAKMVKNREKYPVMGK
ncbi:MAG: nucleotide pyrophosphohydrolase [Bacillus sp. (in: firmicutes)]